MRAGLMIVAALGGLAVSGCGRDPDPTPGAAPNEQRQRVLLFWQRLGAATDARIAGDCTRARDLYLEALRLDPGHEDSLYYLGQCHRDLRQPGEARRSFERLVEVNPASARGHLALGALLASSDPGEPLDLETAEAHLRRAHEINGEETGPMVRLGEILIVRDQAEEGRTWLEAAARTNPKSVEAPFLLGYLRWEAGDVRGTDTYLEGAARAARTDVPTKGVLGEGDRRAPAAAAAGPARAAPPLREPMGRTLFSELARPLGTPDAESVVAKPDPLYRAVRQARRAIAGRRVFSPLASASPPRRSEAEPRWNRGQEVAHDSMATTSRPGHRDGGAPGDAAPPRSHAWLYVDPGQISTSALSKFAPGWDVNLSMSCRIAGDKVEGYGGARLTILPMTVRPTDAAHDAELELQVMLTRGEVLKGEGEKGLVSSFFLRKVRLKVVEP